MGAFDDLQEVKKDLKEIKQESFAMEFVKDYKKQNKRLFVMWLITFIALIALLGYTLYLHNDIGVEETTITQENESGYNNYIGNDGEITNGKTND